MPLPIASDILSYTTEQIDTEIDRIIEYYEGTTGGKTANTFGGSDGSGYVTFIQQILVPTLQRKVLNNPATDLQEVIETDTELDFDIMQSKNDLKIAEQRVKTLRNTNNKSYYESWFPLNRPLRSSTHITLIALGIFFLAFTCFVLLSSIGFSFNLTTTWVSDSPILDKLTTIFPFGYGTILLVIVLIIAVVVVYLRKA